MRLHHVLLLAATIIAFDVERDLRKAFRPVRKGAPATEARALAVTAARATEDPKVARALLLAAEQVRLEIADFEEHRIAFLRRGENPKDHVRRVEEIDPLRELGHAIDKALASVAGEEARDEVAMQVLENRRLAGNTRVRSATLSGAPSSDVDKAVRGALTARRDAAVRYSALEITRSMGERGAVHSALMIDQLTGDDPLARLLAARALAPFRSPAALTPLVAALGDERFAVRVAAHRALVSITSQSIRRSQPSWELWLEREGGAYVRGESPLPPAVDVTLDRASGPTYFGLPLEGDGVLFILDRSKSMRRTMGKPSHKAEGDEPDRMKRATEELISALGALRSNQRFDILAFANTSVSFRGELVPASAKNIAAAQAWTRDVPLAFGTGIHDVLQLAFSMARTSDEGAPMASEIDSIYLLTDGVPILPSGKRDRGDAIRSAVRDWNFLGQV